MLLFRVPVRANDDVKLDGASSKGSATMLMLFCVLAVDINSRGGAI